MDEDNETIDVTLTNTDSIAYFGDNIGTVTITDNDPTPAIEFETLANISEGTHATDPTTANVTVKLPTGVTSGRDITATYTLAGVEASVPEDVKIATGASGRTSDTAGTVTIAKGTNSADIPLEIIADPYDEDNETFRISLTNLTGATIVPPSITGTIEDDDNPPVASISSTYTALEESGANTAAGLVVTLTPASTKTVTVHYAFSDISATKGTDYTGVDGDLIFVPGADGLTPTTMFVPFSLTGDVDGDKRFTITLSVQAGANATVDDTTPTNVSTVTIEDDDVALAELKLETEHTDGVLAGDIMRFNVTLTPPPEAATDIMVEAIDTGNSDAVLAGTPIMVTINPAESATSSTTDRSNRSSKYWCNWTN